MVILGRACRYLRGSDAVASAEARRAYRKDHARPRFPLPNCEGAATRDWVYKGYPTIKVYFQLFMAELVGIVDRCEPWDFEGLVLWEPLRFPSNRWLMPSNFLSKMSRPRDHCNGTLIPLTMGAAALARNWTAWVYMRGRSSDEDGRPGSYSPSPPPSRLNRLNAARRNGHAEQKWGV